MKTFLVAVFCVIRCILYPNTKVVIVSGNKNQSIETLNKIVNELMPKSAILRAEISVSNVSLQNPIIRFRNGSYIRVAAANDGARGLRANILILDEFRLLSKLLIESVFKRMKAMPRETGYMHKPEYKDYVELNKEIYMSSAWLKIHWSWQRATSFVKAMALGKASTFITSIPYQVSIANGLLSKESVEEEMSMEDFNEVTWDIEMQCHWLGSSTTSLFSLDALLNTQKIPHAVYPKYLYDKYGNAKNFKYIRKNPDEVRVLVADIALSGGDRNDNTSITLMQLIPNKTNQYIRKFTYSIAINGGRTDEVSCIIRRLYEELDCDYIVLDTRSFGLSIYDMLTTDLYDKEMNVTYKPLSCMNNDSLADRCYDAHAPRVIYAVNASSKFNSDAAIKLKDAISRGKVQTLVSQDEAKEIVNKFGLGKLSDDELRLLYEPYANTYAFILETVKLEYESEGGIIRVKEVSGMRKDRYTSFSYGNYFADELESSLRKSKVKVDKTDFLERLRKCSHKQRDVSQLRW